MHWLGKALMAEGIVVSVTRGTQGDPKGHSKTLRKSLHLDKRNIGAQGHKDPPGAYFVFGWNLLWSGLQALQSRTYLGFLRKA